MADKCSVNGSGSISSTSNTKYKLKCTGSVTFGNWYWYGVRTRCYISGTQVATATGYTTGPNQTTASCSGTKTITRTHSSQTITWKVVSSSETVSGYGGVGESHTTSGTLTVPALPHQSVIYDANNGSGAPSTQTKWYGETLYLSKTKPTRTGYSFVCWNTNSSGTGDNYYPGDAYTSNASSNLKLYAKWQELTGTIEYNLNGGSGTISPTTMYYTTEAFVTSSVPTLTNYVFVGWSTTRYELNEGTADFSSGESFKDPNVIPQNTVLYAVWALAYIPPTISNFKVIRVANSSSTTLDENGEYAYISFNYSKPGYPVNGEMQRYDIGSASCTFKEIDAISPINVSLTKVPDDPSDPDNGSYYGHTTSQNLVEIFKSYNFTITLYDTTHSELPGSTVTQSVVVPTSFITIDCGAGGRSIGLGRPAVSGTNANGLLTVGMDANFEGITTAPTVTDPNDNTTKVATTAFVQTVAAGGSSAIPNPYNTNPEMNGTASYGSSTEYSRGDHVHPSDTNKANAVHTHSASDITSGLATVATSGSYSDLSNKPTIPSSPVQSDWNETDTSDLSYILNKPTIPSASAFGASIDVANRAQAPYDVRVRLLNGDGTELSSDSIPTASSSVMGVMTPTQYSKLDGIESGAEVNVQSDWDETDSSSDAFIQNKPALATVATTGDYDDLIDKPTIPPVKTWYGASDTDAATAAKIVTCSGFSLSDGAIIGILFSTANTAATPTLNVNSTGDTTVYVGDATVNSTTNTLKWSANTMLYFMYDGTYWRYIGAMAAASVVTPDGGGAWWGTSSTAATTRAKASTIANYRLTKGAIVAIRFSNTNTYTSNSVQLNINSTGAKSIYNKAGATSSTNTFTWAANDTLLFMFDGSYYRYIGGSSYDVPSPSSATPEMDGTGAAGSSADYARADHVHPSDSTKADVSSLAAVATSGAYSDLSGTPTLATVATTGDYDDLTDTPTLAAVATSGSYTDLTNKPTIPAAQVQSDWNETNSSSLAFILNKPTLATVATTGDYDDLTDTPNLSVVATSGLYSDLTGTPSLATVATSGLYSDLSGIPSLATVATSGDYDDLTDKPTIPDTSGLAAEISATPMFSGTVKLTLSNEAGTQIDTAEIGVASSSASGVMTQQMVSKLNGIASGAEVNVQADWSESDSSSDAYIQNKPTLATVATTGSYNDLANKPSIPASPVQSDWTETDTSSLAYIDNKPTLAAVATSGSYNDLSSTPTIPAAGIPSGGASGQYLTKSSNTDYDVGWTTGGGGGISLLDVYPVGSIYMSINSTDPGILFGGTWVQLTDAFLLGASAVGSQSPAYPVDDTYTDGSHHGEATHLLTSAESGLPSHRHNWTGDSKFVTYTATTGQGRVRVAAASSGSYYTNYTASSTVDYSGVGYTGTHSASDASAAHNNMPPYLAVYIWKRTA